MSRTLTPLHHPKLRWENGHFPVSSEFGDVYFSRDSGIAETQHVFLESNHLRARWHTLRAGEVFVIGETGFGTGLNFLCAWQLWREHAPATARLHFVSVENQPLNQAQLRKALKAWPTLAALADQLTAKYPAATPGFHRCSFDDGRVTLTLLLGDAHDLLPQLLDTTHPAQPHQRFHVDAWFLDGFAPAKNPELWHADVFTTMARLSTIGTTVTTFTAAGTVKRGLEDAGFTVIKIKGYGRKRSMITAQLNTPLAQAQVNPQRNSEHIPPWYVLQNRLLNKKEAVVIGAGLAGCHAAHALALRGWQVTVMERTSEIASGASGNTQGVLYTKLSNRYSSLTAFAHNSYQYATGHYHQLMQQHPNITGDLCGMLQLANDGEQVIARNTLRSFYGYYPELVRFVTPQQASFIAGVTLPYHALYFPGSGWLNPASVCAALLQHPNITLRTECDVADLHHTGSYWQVLNAQQATIQNTATVIVATGELCARFAATAHLPIKAVRGQVTHVPATTDSSALKTVLCGDGYLAPAHQGVHSAGASFNPRLDDTALRTEDHLDNLTKLQALWPAFGQQHSDVTTLPLNGRVGFRATTPDYLPLCGPVPDAAHFKHDYAALSKNAKADIPVVGKHQPGLFVCAGLGSRGLTYAPLCAELLASLVNQEPLPVERELWQSLHPGRFLIRALIRDS